MEKKYILFIDSGVGGLTTLAETMPLLCADFIFYADTKFAPYGNRSETFLKSHLKQIIIKFSTTKNLVAVVLACNTATTSSIQFLRKSFPKLIFIGTEPASKLALDKGFKSPAIIGTARTICHLKAKNNNNLSLFASKTLASLIEKNLVCPNPQNSFSLCKELYNLANLTKANNCLVLGCTHYSFIGKKLEKMTHKPVFDSNQGVSQRIYALFGNLSQKSSVKIIVSSKNLKELQKYKKILNQILAKQIKL